MLTNLDTVLQAAGSGLNQLVRVHVYAIEPATVDQVRDQLSKRLDPAVRPAITSVLTPIPHRAARVAIDAIAVANERGPAVMLQRCERWMAMRSVLTRPCCRLEELRTCQVCRPKEG